MGDRLTVVAINQRASDAKRKARNGICPFLAQFHYLITTPTLNKTDFILFLKLSQVFYLTILKSCQEIGRENPGFLTGWIVPSTIRRCQMAALWAIIYSPTRYVTSDFINQIPVSTPKMLYFPNRSRLASQKFHVISHVTGPFPCNSVC